MLKTQGNLCFPNLLVLQCQSCKQNVDKLMASGDALGFCPLTAGHIWRRLFLAPCSDDEEEEKGAREKVRQVGLSLVND